LKFLATITVTAIILPLSPIAAVAEDDCGFGRSISFQSTEGLWVYNELDDNYTLPDGSVVGDVSDLVDDEGQCAPTTWIDDQKNDGFGNQFSISISSDEEGPGANSFESIEIFCIKKRLSVYIWVDYPITRGWKGNAQLRMDSGRVRNIGYTVNNTFDGLYLNSPKSFTKSFLAAKSRATFKVNTYEGAKVLAYPKADLRSYESKFKSMGCPLK
jgi:hypothetical protein